MNTSEFRKEIQKIMPGYKWTVEQPTRFKADTTTGFAYMKATGIQSAGFNRMSTLEIVRREEVNGLPIYEARIAGHGTRTPWRGTCKGETLARVLRGLQDQCKVMWSAYASCAGALETGRKEITP